MQATAAADNRAGDGGCLQGRPIKVVDGSTTQLADTPANQLEYPQPSTQKKGCGFPVIKLAVLFSLASGAVLLVLTGNLHRHDLRLFRQMWDCLTSGDNLMGDRAYGEYATLAGSKQRAVDVIARLHQRRKVDFRKAQRLGKNDGLFTWKRGCQQLGIFTKQEWKVLPATIQLRILRFIIDVPFRPKRSEPRAIKRRPKPYPLLHKPRRQLKEIPHRTR